MKHLLLLASVLLFSFTAFAETQRVCFRNAGLYVANVKFTVKNRLGEPISSKEHRRISSFSSEDYCQYYYASPYLADPRRETLTIRVEHYMFLGNATLKKTCEETFSHRSWLVEAIGATVNASCHFTEF